MKFIKAFILFLFIHNLYSQSSYFDVKESQKYNDTQKSTNILSVNTTENNNTVIARQSELLLIFETFDENAKGKKMVTKPLDEREVFAGALFHDDKVKIFSIWSSSKTRKILYCHIYDSKNNTYIKKGILNTTVEKNRFLFSIQNEKADYISISPNKKFIAIATNGLNKNDTSYYTHVFDAKSLKLIYSKSYYSNPEKHFTTKNLVVDNLGKVYIIGKEYFSGRKEKKNKKANYVYILSKVEAQELKTKRIKLGESEFIQNLAMTFQEDKLLLIGYYSEKKEFGIKGVSRFIVNVDDLTILDKRNSEFPQEIFEGVYSRDIFKTGVSKELTGFYLDHVLKDKNGNIFLIAEKFMVSGNYTGYNLPDGFIRADEFDPNSPNTNHYDDILIIKFSSTGDLMLVKTILKRSNQPSYNAFVKDGELHILLNSGKNLSKTVDGRIKVSRDLFESTALYDIIYDSEGNVVYEKIQDNTNKGKTEYSPYKGNYKNGKFVMYNHIESTKQLMILESK